MKRILIIIASLLCLYSISGQTIESTFQHTKFIKASGKNITSNGHLKFVYPAYLEMKYSVPQGDYFIIDGKNVKINMNGKKATVDTDKNTTVRNQRNTLINCITSNYEQAANDNNANISLSEKNGNKIIVISAKKIATRGYSKITITYRKADNMPLEIILEEFNGTINTYKMSNIKKK